MFDAEQSADQSDEDILSPISDFDNLPHTEVSIPLDGESFLFKLCLKIDVVKGTQLNESDFQASFVLLPVFMLKNGVGKSITFPMTKEYFFSKVKPTLVISAVYGGDTIGSSEIHLMENLKNMKKAHEDNPEKFPVVAKHETDIIFDLDGEVIGEAFLEVQVLCLGPVEMQDCTSDVVEGEEDDGAEYDEYVAEINGHSLNIRILRKPAEDADDCECLCDCTGNTGNSIKSGGVGRKGSQILFQLPNTRELCTKSPPNAMSYNIGTCRNGKEHAHGKEKIKLLEGNTEGTQNYPKSDTFVIRLGKKDARSGGKGRLELELTAPRPLTADDFRKPVSCKAVQTEATEQEGKGKKKNKSK